MQSTQHRNKIKFLFEFKYDIFILNFPCWKWMNKKVWAKQMLFLNKNKAFTYCLYSGYCLYFSNSNCHCSFVKGGNSLNKCQSTIDKPDFVNLNEKLIIKQILLLHFYRNAAHIIRYIYKLYPDLKWKGWLKYLFIFHYMKNFQNVKKWQ